MQKRLFKFNILDVVIFLVVACTICVLVFHETITEVFEEATMVTLEVNVVVEGEENVLTLLGAMDSKLAFEPRVDDDVAVEMKLTDSKILPGSVTVPNKIEVTLSCIGYEKLGRYYTESGERIYNNTECTVIIDGTDIVGNVVHIAEKVQ